VCWTWVHIDDLAEAIVLACKKRSCISGEIFDISSPEFVPYKELRRKLAKISGCQDKLEWKLFDKKEKGWNEFMLQNVKLRNQKARDILEWVPKHLSFLDELDIYYQAFLAHQK